MQFVPLRHYCVTDVHLYQFLLAAMSINVLRHLCVISVQIMFSSAMECEIDSTCMAVIIAFALQRRPEVY